MCRMKHDFEEIKRRDVFDVMCRWTVVGSECLYARYLKFLASALFLPEVRPVAYPMVPPTSPRNRAQLPKPSRELQAALARSLA